MIQSIYQVIPTSGILMPLERHDRKCSSRKIVGAGIKIDNS